MHKYETSFGQRLRQLRRRVGLSQAALAERAGLATAAVAALERGVRRSPYPQTLSALAEALELSAEQRAAFVDVAFSARSGAPRTTLTASEPVVQPPRLPVWLTPLIGRHAEVATARALLDPSGSALRLLTLVGPGGVGKTRLAVAVAAELAPVYRDGVVFVDLAPLHEARLVAATIASALGVQNTGGRSARELILEHVGGRQALLVLDNFEHLLPAAPLLTELLQAGPRLTLLVTSRSALRLRGEQRFNVAPLPTPISMKNLAVEPTDAAPAVQLFVKRAQAVAPDFALTATNASAVAGVCQRLDGLPLAIELAAARVGLLPPEALLRRLEHRLPLLTGGLDLPERQRTMRTAIAWSLDLLEPHTQALFSRLAVFAGGWTLRAAEMVCADSELPDNEVLDHMQTLLDSSLIQRLNEDGHEPRFGMLATVREYAGERLLDSGQTETFRARLCDWCQALVEWIPADQLGLEQVARLDREQDNLRQAIRWAIQSGDAEKSLRLGIGCWSLWYLRGRYSEGRVCLAEILAVPGITSPDNLRVRALIYAGHLAYLDGAGAAAEALLQEGLRIATRDRDQQGIVLCLQILGNVARAGGDLANAKALFERGLALLRKSQDPVPRTAMAPTPREMWYVFLLAYIHYELGDFTTARAFVAEVLDLCAAGSNPAVHARALVLGGHLAQRTGDDMVDGQIDIDAGLAELGELGDRQGLSAAHLLAAHSALDSGQRVDAARHVAIALVITRETREPQQLVRALESAAELLAVTDPERALSVASNAATIRQIMRLPAAPTDEARLHNWIDRTRQLVADGRVPECRFDGGPDKAFETALTDVLRDCGSWAVPAAASTRQRSRGAHARAATAGTDRRAPGRPAHIPAPIPAFQRVWSYLVRCTSQTDPAQPLISEIGRATGLSDRQVQRAIRSLEEAGLVRTQRGPGRQRHDQPGGNRYWLQPAGAERDQGLANTAVDARDATAQR